MDASLEQKIKISEIIEKKVNELFGNDEFLKKIILDIISSERFRKHSGDKKFKDIYDKYIAQLGHTMKRCQKE